MNIYQPYTYLIGWSNLNMYYYGVRYAKNCNPKDLWIKYFTSSKYVKQFRDKHGEPDIIQIRKTFSNSTQAIEWEDKVIFKMQLHLREDFLNKNRAKGFLLSPEVIHRINSCPIRAKKISESHKGKKFTEEHRKNISIACKKRDPKTRLHSKETKEIMSMNAKKYNPGFSKKYICPKCKKEGQKAAISRYHGLQGEKCGFSEKYICPKCKKEGSKPLIARWHGLQGEKCKW